MSSLPLTSLPDGDAQRHAERALLVNGNFIAALLDTVGALVAVLDADGRIVLFNKACEAATGYRFAEVSGRLLWDLPLTAEGKDSVRQMFAALCSGDFHGRHEHDWVTKDGQLRRIAWSNTALFDVGLVIATGVDITEIERHRNHLRELAAEQTADLRRAKEMFLANISHELRSPLHSMLIFSHLGCERAGAVPREKLKEYFERIQSGGNQMVSLLDDLLDLSKLEAGGGGAALDAPLPLEGNSTGCS